MSLEFTVTVKATSITVFPGEQAIPLLKPLLDLCSYEDEYVELTKVIGYVYDESSDIIYLHKGVDIKYIQRLLQRVNIVIDDYDEFQEMEFDYEEIIPPKNDEQVDVINFLTDKERHQSNYNSRQSFLVLGTGKGKMEPYSRKIPAPVPSGYIRMGDIEVGDYVFDQTGKPTKVLQIYEHGWQDVYNVRFEDGRIAKCGEEHLWSVVDDIMSDDYVTKTTREIMNDKTSIYYIPSCSPVQYPKIGLKFDPWVIGCCMACFTPYIRNETNSLRMSFDSDRFMKILRTKYSISEDYKHTCFNKETYSNFLLQDLAKYTEYIYTIPDEYMYNDIDTRVAVLQGIFDTIGNTSPIPLSAPNHLHSSSGYYYFIYAVRADLAHQIKTLINSLGKSCEFTPNEIYVYDTFDIGYQPFLETVGTSDKEFGMVESKSMYNKPLQIEEVYKCKYQEQSRCIVVDNPDHLYLTEDYIVTHNTYCTSTAMCERHIKSLIITHRDSLRDQWRDTLVRMMGMTNRDVHVISDGAEIYDIANGNIEMDYDVYLMTHHTFRAAFRRFDNMKDMRNFTKNLGIGIKIIDEAHLEFRDTLMMDFVFNVYKNIYLTATFGRSSKEENSIFKHVFINATHYSPKIINDNGAPKKWVEYVMVEVNTHVPLSVYRYRIVGGRGMNPASYGKFVIKRDKEQTHFKACEEILREIYDKDDKAKVIVFMPLIDLCSEAAYFFNMHLNYDDSFGLELNIKTINSNNTKSENEYNKRADIIVTTIGSCGTGTDIPGITDVICCSPFKSAISAIQVFGRIRYCGKLCHYYDIYDSSVQMDKIWLKCRAKVMKPLATSSKMLTFTVDAVETE